MRGFLTVAWTEFFVRRRLILFGVLTVFAVVAVVTGEPEELKFLRESNPQAPLVALDVQLGSPLAGILNLWLSILAIAAALCAAFAIDPIWSRGDAAFFVPKPVSRGTIYALRLSASAFVYGATLFAASIIVTGLFALAHHGFTSRVWWLPFGHLVLFLIGYLLLVWFVSLSGSYRRGVILAIVLSLLQWGLGRLLQADALPIDGGLREVTQLVAVLMPGFPVVSSALVSSVSGVAVTSWTSVVSLIGLAIVAFWWTRSLFVRREF